ncbi:MAG: glycoside hydrolase N-terminal domain-containing protein [Ignavibacteriales bacterium]|nr:glycoside hydrolase N-terminal domain-containing protein [Ignavibacteriales bacterium]
MKTIKSYFVFVFFLPFLFSCTQSVITPEKSQNDLVFDSLATSWDEAIPLGNGMLGALVWKNGKNLRISLDRADLWDLRPMDKLDFKNLKFKWVYDQWKNNTYENVQKYFDVPYDQRPAPTKIPAGALEFDIEKFGKIKEVRLYVKNALCEIVWESGAKLTVFVHATEPIGWYRFEGISSQINSELVPPPYEVKGNSTNVNSLTGQDLGRLEYKKGVINTSENSIIYDQEGWGGFKYKIHVNWAEEQNKLTGAWSISSEFPEWEKTEDATETIKKSFTNSFQSVLDSHLKWWKNYWSKSNISIPDSLLQKQWYLEMYKFGSAARKGAPPISLQSVWTADNGMIPPWKGDFHHDLNTQLSYWPAYAGNQLELEEGFIDWLWKYKDTFKKYTKDYYETKGLNVPGVTTLTGKPMGGWIQYSLGPTVSAWLAHHFYLHWQYSNDRKFLEEKAYPWIKDVAIHLDELSVIDGKTGRRKLPLSSSPEIFNNSREAWFEEITNFDLALIRWTFEKASELANELNLKTEAEKWERILNEWPDFAVDEKEGLKFSTKVPYFESHRHFSHLMAFHPLGLIDWSQGKESQNIISNTLRNLEKQGSDWWTGYSFSWLGNLYARAFDGEKAAEALRIFAECFCLKNSFHVNGDQCKAGHSKFLYRPFTLEGNFAFASAIMEMLIQSHTGVVKIFPAVPKEWKDISFKSLRTVGAFLVSAKMTNGQVVEVNIFSEKGGEIKMENPFNSRKYSTDKNVELHENILSINLEKGKTVNIISDL